MPKFYTNLSKDELIRQTSDPKGHIYRALIYNVPPLLKGYTGLPSCFSDQPKKHEFGWCWNLASCQVLLNSFQWFQRRSRKYLGQSEARAAILFSRSARKTNLIEDVEILFPQVLLNSVHRFQSRKCLSQSEARPTILFFPIGPKNTCLVDVEILSFVEFRSAVSEEKSKMSQPIRRHLFFPIGQKNNHGKGRSAQMH